MALNTIGDLSHFLLLRNQGTQAKADVTRLSQELTTGLHSDVGKAAGFDYSALSAVERSLRMNESYARVTSEAAIFVDAAQSALAAGQESLGKFGPAILAAANSGDFSLINVNAADAAERMNALISAINVSSAGRHVFGGQSTDTAPLASADTMLDALRVATNGITDPADYGTAIDAWFDGPDFETIGYLGSDTPIARFLLDEDTTIKMDVTAQRTEIREALSGLAKVALLPTSQVPADGDNMRVVLNDAATQTMKATNGLASLGAEIGAAQEAIEQVRVRHNVENTGLQIARSDILSADPFETATALEQARLQLESLYVITARVANLKLSDYLR